MSLQIYKKYNWNRAGACFTIHVEERQAGKEHYCIHGTITLADENIIGEF